MNKDNYNYGVIGNGRSCAIIDEDCSIVFACLPDFDSGTVFGQLLDEKIGGHFGIEMVDGKVVDQHYERNTCVLKTIFEGDSGRFEVIDFMPRYQWDGKAGGRDDAGPDIARIIVPTKGRPVIKADFQPKLAYARFDTNSEAVGPGIIKSTTEGDLKDQEVYESLYVYTDLDTAKFLGGESIELTEAAFTLLSYHDKVQEVDCDLVQLMLQRTRSYWQLWCARTHAPEKWREQVLRSAMTLKMLQFGTTGAMLAAGTTSLPETIGEERNWDYRFCWIRDGSMTVSTLNSLGHHQMSRAFIDWVLKTVPSKSHSLQIMYGIRGERELTEETLDHLDGYHGSKPVRIGNAAYDQQQHDIYGVLLDIIYQDLGEIKRTPEGLDRIWTRVRAVTRTVAAEWKSPDRGIWEIRGECRHFVFSKVLCWVAIDRAIKIARELGKDCWAEQHEALRQQIHDEVCERGWSEEKQAFAQSYACDHLDSANLLMAEYGFIEPDHPRFVKTVEKSLEELCQNGLMFRYKNEDDFGEPSSAFTVCSFWMVKALTQIGERKHARTMFDRLVSMANCHGLYGEDLDFETHRHLGNFPQAYSHLALIDCAIALSKDYDEEEEPLIEA